MVRKSDEIHAANTYEDDGESIHCYHRVFGEGDGKKILEDLRRRFCCSLAANNLTPLTLANKNGQISVIEFIAEQLKEYRLERDRTNRENPEK